MIVTARSTTPIRDNRQMCSSIPRVFTRSVRQGHDASIGFGLDRLPDRVPIRVFDSPSVRTTRSGPVGLTLLSVAFSQTITSSDS